MFGSFFSKWLNRPKVPKVFAKNKRSIFLNRYFGIFYFFVAWHCFGYILMSTARDQASKEGAKVHDLMARTSSETVKKIQIGEGFKVKITDASIDDFKPKD